MNDKTSLYSVDEITNALVMTTLDQVKDALVEKGYDPVAQIVGYLISGDPGYITNYKNARDKITSIERGKILNAVVKEYLSN